ncbi:MAG: LysM peptidoglycan-binding domain-containing protein [Lachnospiraceae bacterium]|nr:LysM peptidoglycan-binding domain-containing protein [Lachnospiraceae bacterium]
MELPKNITQIGEPDKHYKIYVEDYVVSFLKQWNPLARDKTMAAALYGRRQRQEEEEYLFVYGAGKLNFLQKEIRHLSQAQKQEIEEIRRRYFPDYEFLGYRILDGERVEGFHICEQETCSYISGYAQFYEQNEAMLSYMLESRQEAAIPEKIDREKYERVRDRQLQRREKYAEGGKISSAEKKTQHKELNGSRLRALRITAAAAFVLLCVLGAGINSSVLEGGKWNLQQIKKDFLEKKLPDIMEQAHVMTQTEADAGKDAERSDEPRELQILPVQGNATESEQSDLPEETAQEGENDITSDSTNTEANVLSGMTLAEESGIPESETEAMTESLPDEEEKISEEGQGISEKEPLSYTVRRGDTLSEISLRNYGSEKYVNMICRWNGIGNPDEIQSGQKILLP